MHSPSAGSTTSTTTTIELQTDYHNAIRFPMWMSLLAFSAVCLAAVTAKYSYKQDRQADVKWTMSVTIISLCLSFLATAMYLVCRAVFVGQIFEMGMVILVLAFWGAGLPVIMNPGNDIAVDNIEVTNANLFFFSWLSFACCLGLSVSLLQEVAGIDVRQTEAKLARWYGLCASSLVVMGASTRMYSSNICHDSISSGNMFCKRVKLGISLGVIGFVSSAILTYLNQLGLTALYELVATAILLIMWSFGVGYITFGSAPGARIGNLYFATWICFILSVILFGQCFRDVMRSRYGGGGSNDEAAQREQQMESANHMHSPNHQHHPEIPDEDDI